MNIPPETRPSSSLDLLLIGAGPSSLSIAAALHDFLHPPPTSPFSSPTSSSLSPPLTPPKILLLDSSPSFSWHSGMQLPSSTLQISFLKDLALPRSPTSPFTFLSYLHHKRRLNSFINLATSTPRRVEWEDYLRWCCSFFERQGYVRWGTRVEAVEPFCEAGSKDEVVKLWRIFAVDVATGEKKTFTARHVVIATGGQPSIPAPFPTPHPHIIHSSTYLSRLPSALPCPSAPYNIAIIGQGQSAAEIFSDLPTRYPNATVTLLIKGTTLRPSDDSPFVNEVFEPGRVDEVFALESRERSVRIKEDKPTNYGVVRGDLLQSLYERLYVQRVEKGEDEEKWKMKIKTERVVRRVTIEPKEVGGCGGREKVRLAVWDGKRKEEEEMVVDAVFLGTGYVRNGHEELLKGTRHLLPNESRNPRIKIPVRRDYSVAFDKEKVDESAGIWLQGCNEETHGLSDTLLSILAVRGGEIVQSIFGDKAKSPQRRLFKAKF